MGICRRSRRALLTVLAVTVVVGLAAASAGAQPVTLRYFNWGLGEEPWGSYIREMTEAFQKANPQIKVTLEAIGFAEKEKVFATQAEAGRAPDVAVFLSESMGSFIDRGYLLDLAPSLKRDTPDFAAVFYEPAVRYVTRGGAIFGVPFTYQPMILVYNTRLFEKAGLDPAKPPRTWEELVSYGKRLTHDTNNDGKTDQWGMAIIGSKGPGIFPRLAPFIWSAGGDFLTADEKGSALNRPETKEGFKFYVELFTKHGIVPPGVTEVGPQQARTLLAHGQVAMLIGSSWTPGIVDAINPAAKARETLRFAPIPVRKSPATAINAGYHVIAKSTRHPEEAWRFVNFLTSHAAYQRAYEVNGWIVARKDTNEWIKAKGSPFDRVMIDELGSARFFPATPKWPQITDALILAAQDALTGTKTPEQALADAHERASRILAR
jgi:ABC-type glycerol-3-phosphate transport system substrate-binding protein